VTQTGGSGSQTTGYFLPAKGAFQRAANSIAKKKNFKQPCNSDFAALGITMAAVEADAANLNIQNGYANTTLESSLYANTPQAASAVAQYGSETIGQYFAQNPSTVAEAQLNGNTIYINPALVNPNSYFQNLGVVLHEILHNVTGLTDNAIQSAFGLSTSGVSDNITQKLIKDCF
jgi:hypothetical protein